MKIQEISRDQWHDAISDVQWVSFFEYPEWYAIWERYFKTRSHAYLIDEHLLISVIILQGARGRIQFYNSSPAGTYSNLRSLKGPRVLNAIDLKRIRSLTSINLCRLNPFTNVTLVDSQANILNEYTHIIQLDQENVMKGWSRNHKRVLDSARQSCLEICVAESNADWDQYYAIYNQFKINNRSTLSSNYSKDVFDYIRQLDARHVQLWLAKIGNQVVAGRIVFYTKDYAVEWHAVSSEDANKLGANHLIVYSILEDAFAQGIEVYDFNPSAGIPGVEQFKVKFGAIKKVTPVFKQYDLKQRLYLQYTKFRT